MGLQTPNTTSTPASMPVQQVVIPMGPQPQGRTNQPANATQPPAPMPTQANPQAPVTASTAPALQSTPATAQASPATQATSVQQAGTQAYPGDMLPSIPPPPLLTNTQAGNNTTPAATNLTSPTSVQPTQPTDPLLAPLPEIPPPHVVAPRLFPEMQTVPQQQQQAPSQQPKPDTPAPQQPQNQQKEPPKQPQQPQPQQNQQQPQQPATKPTDISGPLNDKTVRSLNDRLNDIANEGNRADAAVDFLNLMQKNPGLADDPIYKPYVDAFLEKILKDPSPMVRQGALLILQLGLAKSPSQNVIAILQELSRKNNLYGIESQAANDILASLQTGGIQDGNGGQANQPGQAAQGQQPPEQAQKGKQQKPEQPDQPQEQVQSQRQRQGQPNPSQNSQQQTVGQPAQTANPAGSGGKLNLVSSQQQPQPQSPAPGGQQGGNPSGQRLNIQEGQGNVRSA